MIDRIGFYRFPEKNKQGNNHCTTCISIGDLSHGPLWWERKPDSEVSRIQSFVLAAKIVHWLNLSKGERAKIREEIIKQRKERTAANRGSK